MDVLQNDDHADRSEAVVGGWTVEWYVLLDWYSFGRSIDTGSMMSAEMTMMVTCIKHCRVDKGHTHTSGDGK
jgi:hypothetical protein